MSDTKFKQHRARVERKDEHTVMLYVGDAAEVRMTPADALALAAELTRAATE